MQFNWQRFSFNRSNRIGMLYFAAIILVLISLRFIYNNTSENKAQQWFNTEETKALQAELDSLRNIREKKKDTIYPFNPNFLTDYRGFKLGMSVKEIDRLLAYREKDKWVNSAKEFQQITQISDSLLIAIEPYFEFPEWVVQKEKKKKESKNDNIWQTKKDINTISITDLQQIRGIGPALAKRIMDHKKRIGDYRDLIQLKDIWGLKYEVRDRIEANLHVDKDFEKIDINHASIIQLSEIPYFDYELSRKVFQFIQVRQGIHSFKELGKLQEFPFDKIERIKLYLKINN